jgi:hypothetical protein
MNSGILNVFIIIPCVPNAFDKNQRKWNLAGMLGLEARPGGKKLWPRPLGFRHQPRGSRPRGSLHVLLYISIIYALNKYCFILQSEMQSTVHSIGYKVLNSSKDILQPTLPNFMRFMWPGRLRCQRAIIFQTFTSGHYIIPIVQMP